MNMPLYIGTLNGTQITIIFGEGTNGSRRIKTLFEALRVCVKYIHLPPEVIIKMYPSECLSWESTKEQVCIGLALSDRKTIVIAKRKLNELGATLAHELGHIEHLNKYPDSTEWAEEAREEYALVVENYFKWDQCGQLQRYDQYPYISIE